MTSKRASWVFWRVYLALALLMLAVGAVLELLLESHDAAAQQQRDIALLQGSFAYVQSLWQLAREQDATDLNQTFEQALAMPVQVYALADFSGQTTRFDTLRRGEIVVFYNSADEPAYYRRLGDSAHVVALTPPVVAENRFAYWIVPLFYSLIGLLVFLWVRPLARDLDLLQNSAQRFGRQDFTTRVSVSPRSWLAPLGLAFNSMAERIQWLLQSHKELTHAVSHELRTPLARMRFALEMMRGDAAPESQARHQATLVENIEEVDSLIEEMLGYAQLSEENLSPRLEPLELRPWLADYLARRTVPGCAAEVSMEVADNMHSVLVDARMLARVLDNLLGNAGRYAKQRICVRVDRLGYDNRLCVDDDGPGIAADQREFVLGAFRQAQSASSGVTTGFGLGLAIVQRIAQLHQGNVTIAESPQGGARVCFAWPNKVGTFVDAGKGSVSSLTKG